MTTPNQNSTPTQNQQVCAHLWTVPHSLKTAGLLGYRLQHRCLDCGEIMISFSLVSGIPQGYQLAPAQGFASANAPLLLVPSVEPKSCAQSVNLCNERADCQCPEQYPARAFYMRGPRKFRLYNWCPRCCAWSHSFRVSGEVPSGCEYMPASMPERRGLATPPNPHGCFTLPDYSSDSDSDQFE